MPLAQLEQYLNRLITESSMEDLWRTREEMHMLFHRLLANECSIDDGRTPPVWFDMINAMHDKLIARTVQLTERQLMEAGRGNPPAPYAFMLFGSGGRREQTLWSDQDNGLVYGEPAEGGLEDAERYFAQFGQRVVANLQLVGYMPCDGRVLSSNLHWRRSVANWNNRLDQWFGDPTWEHVRYLLMFADMRCIYGNRGLTGRVTAHYANRIRENPGILQLMLSNTLHHKVALNIFGQVVKERYGEDAGGVEIKYGVYIPMVNAVRLLAVHAGIRETSTLDRIALLQEKALKSLPLGVWSEALAVVLQLRQQTSHMLQDGQYGSSGYIHKAQLTKTVMEQLKTCIKVGIGMQKYVKRTILKQPEVRNL